jgi:signal peptidase I
VILQAIGVLLLVAEVMGERALTDPPLAVVLLFLGATFLVTLWLNARAIAWLFAVSFPRALLIWLFSLLSLPLLFGLAYFVLIPHVFVAYISPANPMIPTVVGWHNTAVCPLCQGTLLLPSYPPGDPSAQFQEPQRHGVCAACRKPSTVPFGDTPAEAPDRILLNKLLSIRRWDVVAYQFPERGMFGRNFTPFKAVSRVVGLPGEVVYIKDGGVWVNDARVEFPPEMAGQAYTLLLERPGVPGTAEEPWRLGANEYILLGDNTLASNDSRNWGALPASEIEGVVAVTYWPPSRWKVHR